MPLRASLLGSAVLLAAAGCRGVEGPRTSSPTPDPGRAAGRSGAPSWAWTTLGESIDRPVNEEERPRPRQWVVEAGPAEGGLDEGGSAMPDGLAVVARADAPSASESLSVEQGTPATFGVGVVRWPGGPDDPAGRAFAGREVRVEWSVCLSPRGTCAVDVEAVPRLVSPAGDVVVLERFRVHRVVAVDEALVIGTSAGRTASATAAALVGTTPKAPARFVLRVRA